uniref:Uncharacterized protein n=1 Tax=Chrysotila carterae TaxID=13221 RepID=A0A7S4EXA0_CHRCT
MARNALTILSMLGAAEALTTGVVLRAPKVRTARLTMQDAAAPAEAAEEEAVPPPPPPPPPVEYSQSMPFLVKRKALNGYVGDVGFDPLGFSEILPMDWLREAELKHCRVCMLATVRAPPRRPFTHPFRLLVGTPAQPHVVVMTLHILADVAAIVWLSIGCTLASLRLANSNALHANPCLWSFRLFAVSAASQVGFVFTDFLTLPGSIYQVSTLDAHDVSVASGSMSQLLLWIGARTGAVSPPSGRHDFNST